MKRIYNFRVVEADPNEVDANEILLVRNNQTGGLLDIQKRNSEGQLQSLFEEKVALTIIPSPTDATVKLDGQVRSSIVVPKGSTVLWEVSADDYITQLGSQIVNQNMVKPVTLVANAN